jgi:DNA-binding beta-propeller fold protein YncE
LCLHVHRPDLKIDTASYQVTQTLKLTSQNPYYYTSVGPAWLTLSHDGTFLCATNTFNDTVSIVDTAALTERHQVVFREVAQAVHTPNFTFRNNVLLNETDSLGFIPSVGTQMLFGVVDRVYEFDPVTGLRSGRGRQGRVPRDGGRPQPDHARPERRVPDHPSHLLRSCRYVGRLADRISGD